MQPENEFADLDRLHTFVFAASALIDNSDSDSLAARRVPLVSLAVTPLDIP